MDLLLPSKETRTETLTFTASVTQPDGTVLTNSVSINFCIKNPCVDRNLVDLVAGDPQLPPVTELVIIKEATLIFFGQY